MPDSGFRSLSLNKKKLPAFWKVTHSWFVHAFEWSSWKQLRWTTMLQLLRLSTSSWQNLIVKRLDKACRDRKVVIVRFNSLWCTSHARTTELLQGIKKIFNVKKYEYRKWTFHMMKRNFKLYIPNGSVNFKIIDFLQIINCIFLLKGYNESVSA